MGRSEFEQAVESAASFFSSFSGSVLIVSHIDCDGLAASAILVKVCEELSRPYRIMRTRELTDENLKEIADSSEEFVCFADMGSTSKERIIGFLKNKKKIIIDHHGISAKNSDDENLFELNPKGFEIDERREISSSGIAWLFANNLIAADPLLPLALVGALGDAQEEQGFIGYNEEFLNTAVKEGLMSVKKVLRLFGRETRPLLKALQYSTDIPMKGVTNDRDGALNILRSLDIPAMRFSRPVTLETLTEEETKELEEVLLSRMDDEVKARAFWFEYTITDRPRGSATRNLREFSTLMNACGRLDDILLGIRICLGDQSAERLAKEKRNDYRLTINEAKKFIDEHPDSTQISKNLMTVDAGNNIAADIAGTIASIFAKSGYADKDMVVCVMTENDEDSIKISLRTASERIDLSEMLNAIVEKTGGSCGGHANAAGAVIPQDAKEMFVELLKESVK